MTEPARATLLVAATAATRLGAARERLAALVSGARALVLAPSRMAADELVAGLTLRSDAGATFGLEKKTLRALATELTALELAAEGRSFATSLVAEAVARRVAVEALADGELHVLAPRGALAPGLARSLARTFDDLDHASVRSQGNVFDRAPARRGAPSSLASLDVFDRAPARRGAPSGAPSSLASLDEVLALFERWRRAMDALGLATRADVLRRATARLAANPSPAWHTVVLLDVAIGSRAEAELVRAVLSRAESALVTLPPGDSRTVAFTRANLSRPVDLEHDAPLSAIVAETAITLRSAPGEALEAVEIARELHAEARRGVRFDEMAIVLRSPESYASHLATALARAAIPAHFETGTRRPHPAGRALLALLRCKVERGSGRRLSEYVSTGQLPWPPRKAPEPTAVRLEDEDLGRFATRADAAPSEEPASDATTTDAASSNSAPPRPLRAAWERLLGEGGPRDAGSRASIREHVLGRLQAARAELAHTRAGLEREAGEPLVGSQAGALEREAEACDVLAAALDPVLTALDQIPRRGSWAELLAAIARLAGIAVHRPALVGGVLGELELFASDTGMDVELADVVRVLEDRLRTLSEPPGADRSGRVLVTTTTLLRGRARRVVFLPGLSERRFPRPAEEDPLLVDRARTQLEPTLPTSADSSASERVLFHVAVGAATERLHASFPRLELDGGRARVPSLFALELARAESGELPSLDAFSASCAMPSRARLLWPAPVDRTLAIDDLEYALATVRSLIQKGEGGLRGRARFLLEENEVLERALRSRWARHNQRDLTTSDGLVATSERTRGFLASQRLTKRGFAPSTLETYAACPYRFYLRAVARVAPRVEFDAADRLDARTFGELFHRAHRELARAAHAANLDPAERAHHASLGDHLRRAVEVVGERARAELAPLIDRVFDDELRRIEGELFAWLEEEALRAEAPPGRAPRRRYLPFLADFSFGMEPTPDADPSSVRDPVRVRSRYLLRGAIDAIERSADGLLRITDWKTGARPGARPVVVGGGRVLQPVLYAMALRELVGKLVPGAHVEESRLYYATRRGHFTTVPVALDDDAIERGSRVLATIDAAIERGVLVAMPSERACETCPYRTLCPPGEEARTGHKRARGSRDTDFLRELSILRAMV
ncbi:MAG: PD-(D/E)XK nuclease family protein [Polyangiaceae bacterium]